MRTGYSAVQSIGGFEGPWGPCPPYLVPNKFQERPSGASRIQENFQRSRLCRVPHWGSLQRSPDPLAGWLPLFKNSTLSLRPLGLWLRPFRPRPTRNKRHSPPPPNLKIWIRFMQLSEFMRTSYAVVRPLSIL